MSFHRKSLSPLRRFGTVLCLAGTCLGTQFTLAAESVIQSLNTPSLNTPQLGLKYRPAPQGRGIEGRYIVVLKDQYVAQQMNISSAQMIATDQLSAQASLRAQTVAAAAHDMATAYGASLQEHFHYTLRGFVSDMNSATLKRFVQDERVAFIEQDQVFSINATQFDATWGLDRIDQSDLPLNQQYTYNVDGSGVTSYVIDTGVLASHSDFAGRVAGGFTSINDGRGTTDCNGHGTHVAGTIGSNTYGVAKNTTLVPVRVLGCDGSGSNSGVIAGVEWVAANASGPSVANMSLGGGVSSALDNAVQNAIASGVTFVVAAGNENANACNGSPSRVGPAITVASSTASDARSSFSNWGSCVDIFAPGSSIRSTWSDGGYSTISGTSMASPHVAGVAALFLEANPSATPAQVDAAIKAAAVSNRISGVNGSPNRLLQSNVDGDVPPPTPTPTVTPPPSPTPTPTPGDNVLQNGEPLSGLAASQGSETLYTFAVPAGATNIRIAMSGGSGDADLYVRFGTPPSTSTYDCRPYTNGNNESCTGSQSGGTYYVMLRAYSSYSGVTLLASYDEPSTGNPPIDESVENISVNRNDWARYSLDLVSGYSTLTVSISGGSGDADLYVNFGSASTTSSYLCRPYLNGNNETCSFSNPQAGTWHIDIRGYRNSSGITLRVQAQ